MPIRAGDPGVFICGPGDIAPWETVPVPAPPPPMAGHRPYVRPGVWLVAARCYGRAAEWSAATGAPIPRCRPHVGGRPVYCPEHDERNWWLENFRPARRH